MIRVVIADDHELVRTGIKRLLEDFDDIQVVAEACDGLSAINTCEEHNPDVILMDINMPGINGLEATRQLRRKHQNLKIIVVSMHNDEISTQRLLKAGSNGYLTKESSIGEIASAIRKVMNGEYVLSSELAQKLALKKFNPENDGNPFEDLSERELQVMDMLIEGKKITAISEKLCLSPKTVSTYRHRLFSKLGVNSDVELSRLAQQYGLTGESPP